VTSIELDGVGVDLPVLDARSLSVKRHALNLLRSLGGIAGGIEPPRTVQALRNVSLRIGDGDRIGLIGLNGSGKTTLLRVLAGIYEPTCGVVRVCGRVTTLIDLALGFDLEATGYDNITLGGYALGLGSASVSKLLPEIAAFTELGDRLNDPIRTYSAGMLLRLGFATSLMCPHDILLLDEVIGVGDAAFLAKARTRLISVAGQSPIVVLASHALDLVESLCDKAIYLHAGRVVAFGPVQETLALYRRELAMG